MLLEIWVLTYLKVGLTKGWFNTFIMESSRKCFHSNAKGGTDKGRERVSKTCSDHEDATNHHEPT